MSLKGGFYSRSFICVLIFSNRAYYYGAVIYLQLLENNYVQTVNLEDHSKIEPPNSYPLILRQK